MASKYLDKVLKILPAVQARQIAELLKSLQASGQIRNVTEYEQKLRDLSKLVNSAVPQPSFKQIYSLVWTLCSSEVHNTMMTALKNDIEAAFLQVDEIGEKLEDHNILFMSNVLRDLEKNLDEQENTIKRLEWLADQSNEFTHALVNSFTSTSTLQTARSELSAESLYFDNRTYKNKNISELPNALISIEGSKLILSSDIEQLIRPITARLQTDSSSYNSDIQVDISNNLSNILDGKTGTYWSKNVYSPIKLPKVTAVIELSLGSSQDINYLLVQGGANEVFYIESVQAVSPDGYYINLLDDPIEISHNKRIDFNRTLAKSVIVTFATYTYAKAEYYVGAKDKVHDAFLAENQFDKLARRDALGSVVSEALASQSLVDVLQIPVYKPKQINAYKYTLTIDNIWFGNSAYKDSGIFVSKPLVVDNVGVIGLKTIEKQYTSIVPNTYEYAIIKRDISPKYKKTIFPIPTIDGLGLSGERLILLSNSISSSISDVGQLRFCPYIPSDYASGDANPITIYENGEPLSLGPQGWRFAISENTSGLIWSSSFAFGEDFDNYTLSPKKMFIQIMRPKLGAIYSASYTIRTDTNGTVIDTDTVWLDIDNTACLIDNGKVLIKQNNPNAITKSELYLQITLRRNLPSVADSPELYEYALLASTY